MKTETKPGSSRARLRLYRRQRKQFTSIEAYFLNGCIDLHKVDALLEMSKSCLSPKCQEIHICQNFVFYKNCIFQRFPKTDHIIRMDDMINHATKTFARGQRKDSMKKTGCAVDSPQTLPNTLPKQKNANTPNQKRAPTWTTVSSH